MALFLLLLGFAVKNTDGRRVRYFLGLEWQAPLVLHAAGRFSRAGVACAACWPAS